MRFKQTSRAAISPFLATVILVVITLAIGGVLYTQFRQMIVSQVKDPSVTLVASNVAPDGETMTFNIKNDGNVPIALTGLSVSYGGTSDSFTTASNTTIVASSGTGATMQPGDMLTASVKTNFVVPSFSTFTVTIIGDQTARAFNVQA